MYSEIPAEVARNPSVREKNLPPKRILIVGPGALGVINAVRLSVAGHDVSIAARSADKAALLTEVGFRVDHSVIGQQIARLNVISRPADLLAPVDVLILATKSAGAADVARMWLPALDAKGTFVPQQNGLLGDEFLDIVGDRLVECVVYYPATLVAPGHSRLTGPGQLYLGPWPRGRVGKDSRAVGVAALLADVVPAFTHDDMFSVKWNKLVANSAMTSLGVLSGLQMGGMMQHSIVRRAFIEIVAEGLSVARAAGARPMSLNGFNPALIARLPRFIVGSVLRFVTRKHGEYKSSSQQSLERGEPTEVEYLNGRIVAEANRFGLDVPWNRETVAAVHAVEANPGKTGISTVAALADSVRLNQNTAAAD